MLMQLYQIANPIIKMQVRVLPREQVNKGNITMKLKTFLKKLDGMSEESEIEFLTPVSQWGKVVGVHEEKGRVRTKIVIDVVENDKSWENPPY